MNDAKMDSKGMEEENLKHSAEIRNLEEKEFSGNLGAMEKERMIVLYFLTDDLKSVDFFFQRQEDLEKGIEYHAANQKVVDQGKMIHLQRKKLYFALFKALLNRNYVDFFRLLPSLTYSESQAATSELMGKFVFRLRENICENVATVFKTIKMQRFSEMVGLDMETAHKFAMERGFDIEGEYAISHPKKSKATVTTSLEKLERIKEYALDLEETN